ncbi:FecR family protein [Bacteroides ihuae]|uniref:FecR family protein n=1 Tax=Bacteroides ihuae TaxID=1852362 RepID=UPI0008DB2D91|nr:FecR family protein [Bacteroides ihuae]
MKDYISKIIRIFTDFDQKPEITKEVHQWLLDSEHADEKETALKSLWERTEQMPDASTWDSLAAVYKKMEIDKKTSFRYLRLWRYAAAAVILLAVSVSGTFFLTKNRYSEVAMVQQFTPDGNMKTVELPDGSFVQTNSGTLLLYPKAFKGDTRTVYLIGEANFKVKKNPDKPFIVKSTTMSVTALGTEFNVAAYPESNEIVATLIHGKVFVDCGEGKRNYILSPGQEVTFSRNTGMSFMKNANLADVTAWQKGEFVFRGVTIKGILSTLERRFNMTIQCNVSFFNNDKYNFRFRKNADITEILEVMKEVVGGFKYKIDGNVCYLKSAK